MMVAGEMESAWSSARGEETRSHGGALKKACDQKFPGTAKESQDLDANEDQVNCKEVNGQWDRR